MNQEFYRLLAVFLIGVYVTLLCVAAIGVIAFTAYAVRLEVKNRA